MRTSKQYWSMCRSRFCAVSLAVPTVWSRSRSFAIARRSLRPSRSEALVFGCLSDGRLFDIVARKNGRTIGCPKLASISCQSGEISQGEFSAEHYWLEAYPAIRHIRCALAEPTQTRSMGLRARAWLSQAKLGVKKLTHTTGQAGSLSHGTARSGRAFRPTGKDRWETRSHRDHRVSLRCVCDRKTPLGDGVTEVSVAFELGFGVELVHGGLVGKIGISNLVA